MTETAALEHRNDTGLSDSTHNSSVSAERYCLDEFDDNPILLYKYRSGLQTSSQRDLCSWLDKDEKLRVTKKPIPRLTSYVDVKRHDLYLPEEKEQFASFPNYDSNLASVKVPSMAYWSRALLGNYHDLYIVSPESSPSSSIADDDSRRTSPTFTWGHESSDETKLGAMQDRGGRSQQ